ncbi:MAG: DUF6732 family protein [Litoreibacter sp.]
MRILLSLLLMTTPALAHVGHVGGLAGHDHWVAGVAIGLAIGVGIWGALKGKKDPGAEEVEIEEEPTGDEEPA